MKRRISLLLILALLLSLTACSKADAVTFYYVRQESEYQYGVADGVIVGERREVTGHINDLRYLLILYLHGPITENLTTPFPSGTTLEELSREDDTLHIRLSGIVSVLEGADLTLACACLARTCFSLTTAETVSIVSEGLSSVSMTISRDSLLLIDSSAGDLSNAQ